MIRYGPLFMGFLLSAGVANHAKAELQVLSWNLRTSVADTSGPSVVQDVDRFLVVTNDWQQTSISQVGLNTSQAQYDYSWIRNELFGGFQSDLLHEIRTSEVHTVSTAEINVVSSEDVRVRIDAFCNYWHTPGDESAVLFGANIVSVPQNQPVLGQTFTGGNLYLQPSTNNFEYHAETVLYSNQVYKLRYTLDADNTADVGFPPTGILDASGFVNFTIMPIVPEPSTLAILAPGLLLVTRRRRGSESDRGWF